MAVVTRTTSAESKFTAKTEPVVEVENFDITANLVTLRVESSIPESKKRYLKLRARAHMLQTTICAHVSFFASALSEARRIRSDLILDSRALGRRKLMGQERKDQLKVGIIGCGRLGQRIAQCLLSYGGLKAQDIVISTRRPETQDELKERNIQVIYNNLQLVKNCHLVLLTVLPSQLPQVCDEIKGQISSECILYSFVPATPLSRLKQILKHNQIISPQFSWPEETEENDWDYCQDVEDVFHRLDMVELTCPVSETSKTGVVQTEEKWVELIMYAFVNHCAQMDLKSLQVTQILNRVLLGITDTNPGLLMLEADDFTRQPLESDDALPCFDLTTVASCETPLTRKLNQEKVRTAFTNHYVNVFQQYNNKLKFDPLHRT